MKYVSSHRFARTLACAVTLVSGLGLVSLAGAQNYPVVEFRYAKEAGKAANTADMPTIQMNLTAAAASGVIDPWQYSYDPAASGNIDPYDQFGTSTESYTARNAYTGQGYSLDSRKRIKDKLSVWNGFWLRTNYYTPAVDPQTTYTDFAIAFDYPVGYSSAGAQSITLPDHWRIISIPLTPSSSFDPYALFTFDKWVNGSTAPGYGSFTNNPAVAEIQPGRGYWATTKNIGDAPTVLTISGSETPINHTFYGSSGDFDQYALLIPASAGDHHGDHMVGNPFEIEYPIQKIWIEVNGDYSGLNLGKIASADLSGIQTWNIGLRLTDATGSRVDAGNAAGVLETGNDLHSLFSARDMVAPKDDYIRLAFKNPEDANTPLCFDYRAPGQDKYEWNVELSTTLNSIATKLSLDNFTSIPEWYALTLTDALTGQVYPLTGDASFDVALTGGAPRTFVLTATRQKPAAVAEAAPAALELKNIFPNPFNPATTISFAVQKAGMVNLSIYNISGQLVDTLVNGALSAGAHQVVWNAAKNSSGIYLVRLAANGYTDTKKVTFMK